jgi:hypothetical protein
MGDVSVSNNQEQPINCDLITELSQACDKYQQGKLTEEELKSINSCVLNVLSAFLAGSKQINTNSIAEVAGRVKNLVGRVSIWDQIMGTKRGKLQKVILAASRILQAPEIKLHDRDAALVREALVLKENEKIRTNAETICSMLSGPNANGNEEAVGKINTFISELNLTKAQKSSLLEVVVKKLGMDDIEKGKNCAVVIGKLICALGCWVEYSRAMKETELRSDESINKLSKDSQKQIRDTQTLIRAIQEVVQEEHNKASKEKAQKIDSITQEICSSLLPSLEKKEHVEIVSSIAELRLTRKELADILKNVVISLGKDGKNTEHLKGAIVVLAHTLNCWKEFTYEINKFNWVNESKLAKNNSTSTRNIKNLFDAIKAEFKSQAVKADVRPILIKNDERRRS